MDPAGGADAAVREADLEHCVDFTTTSDPQGLSPEDPAGCTAEVARAYCERRPYGSDWTIVWSGEVPLDTPLALDLGQSPCRPI